MLKAWIDEIKPDGRGGKSEAQLEQASAPGELAAVKILLSARDEIVAGGVFYFTPETQTAEAAVSLTYKAILAGGSDFDSLRSACAHWVEASRKPPATPEIVSLFDGSAK